jgi:hypothetical protein
MQKLFQLYRKSTMIFHAIVLFLIIIQQSIIVLSLKNCPNEPCKEGWQPIGRYCLKFFKPVSFFSEADDTCKTDGSNILSKSSLIDSELIDLKKEINKRYSIMERHSFWVKAIVLFL